MTSIKFNLSRLVHGHRNEHEILLRFSHGRKQTFRTGSNIFIAEELWNNKKGCVRIPRIHGYEQLQAQKIQSKIEELKNFIFEHASVVDDEEITKDWLVNIVYIFHKGIPKIYKEENFKSTFELFIKMHNKSESEKKHYRGLLLCLMRFELFEYSDFELDINKITDEDLYAFEDFLRIEHTFFNVNGECIKHKEIYSKETLLKIPQRRGDNGIYSLMKKFRTFYNWAVNTGRTTNNPFKRYKLKESAYGTPFFITNEERTHYINLTFLIDLA